jgi:hypothetical protein
VLFNTSRMQFLWEHTRMVHLAHYMPYETQFLICMDKIGTKLSYIQPVIQVQVYYAVGAWMTYDVSAAFFK